MLRVTSFRNLVLDRVGTYDGNAALAGFADSPATAQALS